MLRSGNSCTSNECLPVIEHHRLPWRWRPKRIVERKRCSTATETRYGSLRKRATMSNTRQALHLRTLGDRSLWCRRISQCNVAHIERCAGRNSDPIRHRVNRADIAR